MSDEDDLDKNEVTDRTGDIGEPEANKVEGEDGDVETEDSKEDAEEVDEAVNDIVSHESDELMKAEDAKMMAAFSPVTSPWGKTKEWFSRRRNRYTVIGGLVAAFLLILVVPVSRYYVLNALGVRGSLNVIVLDDASGLPLKNVTVTVGDKEGTTDKKGEALVSGVKLGNQSLQIQKLAYASYSADITISTGTNKIEDVSLKPTGTQYLFVLSDWLGQTPIAGAEVAFGENSVLSNVEGRALLTVPPVSDENIEVLIVADGYKTQRVQIPTTQEGETKVALVIDKPHFFVSEKTGDYNLYKVDLNGDNEELVLKGTGKETDNIQLLDMSNKRSVFLVSSREGKHNDEGSILYGLFDIDSETNEYEKIDESESIRLYGVSQDKLVYVKIVAGASGGSPNRQRLLTYDPITGRIIEIAATNYFNSVVVTDDSVFYAPSDAFKEEKQPYLFRANPTSGEKTTVHAAEVWSIFRTGYEELTFDAKQDWYKVSTVAGALPVPLDARPVDVTSRLYQTSPSAESAAYIDYRDSKGYLIALDISTGQETTVQIQNGMKYPIQWADDNHIVFRVSDSGTADYVVDIRGGEANKLVEVSDIASYDRWYYYY